MKLLTFSYKNTAFISEDKVQHGIKQLVTEIEHIAQSAGGGYSSDYASLNLPRDAGVLKEVRSRVEQKKKLNPTVLVVIGIGGSNLGALAVHQAVHGLLYNESNPAIKVYFADTVDADYILDILLILEQELIKGNNILLNVITKSGSTTETIANFEIFLHLLKRYKQEAFADYVVATTDDGSKFYQFAQAQKFDVLTIPANVGGRYSVFSAAGLFPLGMLGVDLNALLAGARDVLPLESQLHNDAQVSAVLIDAHYRNGIALNDLFLFAPDLEALGKWYRQLMGESIGKEFDRQGKVVSIGITPTVSIGTNDLHSVVQRYLGGTTQTFTTFVTVQADEASLQVPTFAEYEQLVPKIQGKSLATIMSAIVEGVLIAYSNGKRPYMVITLPEKSAYCIGQFMQMKMLEMMYLGYLLNVNPFDQPAVELYKKETRRILAQ